MQRWKPAIIRRSEYDIPAIWVVRSSVISQRPEAPRPAERPQFSRETVEGEAVIVVGRIDDMDDRLDREAVVGRLQSGHEVFELAFEEKEAPAAAAAAAVK